MFCGANDSVVEDQIMKDATWSMVLYIVPRIFFFLRQNGATPNLGFSLRFPEVALLKTVNIIMLSNVTTFEPILLMPKRIINKRLAVSHINNHPPPAPLSLDAPSVPPTP
jgi:hypothetical protein